MWSIVIVEKSCRPRARESGERRERERERERERRKWRKRNSLNWLSRLSDYHLGGRAGYSLPPQDRAPLSPLSSLSLSLSLSFKVNILPSCSMHGAEPGSDDLFFP